MSEDTTLLKLVPVCDCGYVFREGIILRKHIITAENGMKYITHSIDPSVCPSCNKEIEGIEVKGPQIGRCSTCAHAEIRLYDGLLLCPKWKAADIDPHGYCHMWQQKEGEE